MMAGIMDQGSGITTEGLLIGWEVQITKDLKVGIIMHHQIIGVKILIIGFPILKAEEEEAEDMIKIKEEEDPTDPTEEEIHLVTKMAEESQLTRVNQKRKTKVTVLGKLLKMFRGSTSKRILQSKYFCFLVGIVTLCMMDNMY